MIHKKFNFRGEEVYCEFFYYSSGRIGIKLIHSKTGSQFGVATVNLDNQSVQRNIVLIKSYDSNKGLYECLLKNNIIKTFKSKAKLGHNEIHVCELNVEFLTD